MKVPEGYVAFVEELPGANTQGESLEEARSNLREAITLVLDSNRVLSEQSLGNAEVIRETLIVPAASNAPPSSGIWNATGANSTAKAEITRST